MRKEKGITLIALIITIIILIILTAITINNVIGTDLMGFATKAVENYTDAEKEEADKLDELAGKSNNLGVSKDSIVKAGKIVTKTEKDNYTDADGRKATIPAGFKVSTKVSEQHIKDGLVIQDEDGNEFVWVPCYYGTKPDGTPADVQAYKKHEYVTSDGWIYDLRGISEWEDVASKDATSYGNASVTKYGGFYIGRYEAGWTDADTSNFNEDIIPYMTDYNAEVTKKNINTKTPVSKANVFAWTFISQQNAKAVSEKMYAGNDSVQSKLVDIAAWDTAVNWITCDIKDIAEKSSQYGNYSNNNSNYTGWYAEHIYSKDVTQPEGSVIGGYLYPNKYKKGSIKLQQEVLSTEELINKTADIANKTDISMATDPTMFIEIPTGSYDKFKLKNIYDLAGNMWEWTTAVGKSGTAEGVSTDNINAMQCGGCCCGGGDGWCSLAFHTGIRSSTTCCEYCYGFRVALYIQ